MVPTREAQVALLEAECAQIKAQISSLQALLREKRSQLASLALVQSLSDDIMYVIFEAAYLHDFPHCRLHSGLLKDSPVVVTHVCRRWRRLALELPALWSCLHITPKQGAGNPDALKTFLERSQNRDLSIILIAGNATVNWGTRAWLASTNARWPRYQLCLARLLEHSSRWTNCGFYLDHEMQLTRLCKSLHGKSFPSLRFLQILMDFRVDSVSPEWPMYQLCLTAPELQEFRANTVLPTDALGRYRLTDVTIDNCPIPALKFRDILASLAPTLGRLVLRIVDVTDSGPLLASSQPIHLPCLRYLAITDLMCGDGGGLQTVNGMLRGSPNLETFQCVNRELFEDLIAPDPPIHLQHVTSLFMQHDGVEQRAPTWRRSIDMFPAVQDVYVNDVYASGCLAAVTDATADNHVVWPDLRSLAISVRNVLDLDKVSSFLKHRSSVEHPVFSLTLMCTDIQHPEFEQRWEAEGGGSVKVDWKPVPPYDPFNPWDDNHNVPSFKPWKGSLTLEDQDL